MKYLYSLREPCLFCGSRVRQGLSIVDFPPSTEPSFLPKSVTSIVHLKPITEEGGNQMLPAVRASAATHLAAQVTLNILPGTRAPTELLLLRQGWTSVKAQVVKTAKIPSLHFYISLTKRKKKRVGGDVFHCLFPFVIQ